jgi:hypothetical protein
MQHYHLPRPTMNYIPCGKSPFFSNIADVPQPFLNCVVKAWVLSFPSQQLDMTFTFKIFVTINLHETF